MERGTKDYQLAEVATGFQRYIDLADYALGLATHADAAAQFRVHRAHLICPGADQYAHGAVFASLWDDHIKG